MDEEKLKEDLKGKIDDMFDNPDRDKGIVLLTHHECLLVGDEMQIIALLISGLEQIYKQGHEKEAVIAGLSYFLDITEEEETKEHEQRDTNWKTNKRS